MALLNFKHATFCKLVFILTNLQFIWCKGIGESEYEEFNNCTLRPASIKDVLNLEKMIKDDNRLINIGITLEWLNYTHCDSYLSTRELSMTTSVSGQRLLLLPDHFSEMSFGTLSYGVADLQIKLKQVPEDCLANFTIDEAEYFLKYVMLTLPKNPESRNEGGISNLHICNKTEYSYGSCCAVTLEENYMICHTLEHIEWGNVINWMLGIITVMVLLQSVSFIPKDAYTDIENERFTLTDTTVNMHIQVTDSFISPKDFKWVKVQLSSHDILKTLCEKLNECSVKHAPNRIFTACVKVNHFKSIVDKRQLQSESFSSSGILMFLYDSFRDLFRLLKSSGRCCHCLSLSRFWWYVDKIMISLLFILLLVPFILRLIFAGKYEDEHLFIYLFAFIGFIVSESIFLAVVNQVAQTGLKFKTHAFKTLREIVQYCLRTTFETESLTNNKYEGHSISIFMAVLIYVKSYFPLLQFFILLLSNAWQYTSNKRRRTILLSLLLISIQVVTYMFYLVIDCVLFYVKCFFCTMLGLLLNYDKVFQYVLLILIVVKYAYDSMSDVQKKIERLKKRVLNHVRGHCTGTNPTVLIKGKDENLNLLRFAICKCGKLCLLPRGVILFDKLIEPENTCFKHVSKKFVDDISSLPGHLTPGSVYSLLFRSGKEIASVIVILFFVLILVLGFGNVKNLSSGVLTIVTLVSGTVSSILAKLWFKDTEYVADDDIHLGNLIKDHLVEYEEPWIINEFGFNIIRCKGNSEQIIEDKDISMVVEKKDGQVSYFIKQIVQKNTFLFECEGVKCQLRRMFLTSSFDEESDNDEANENFSNNESNEERRPLIPTARKTVN